VLHESVLNRNRGLAWVPACLCLLPLAGWCQPEPADWLSARVARYNQAAAAIPDQRLLDERSAALYRLIAADPAAALDLALPMDGRETIEGVLRARVEDDFAGHRSRTRWSLETPGARFEVFFRDGAPRLSGAPVALRGLRVGDRVAAASASAAGLPAGRSQVVAPQCTTTGAQQIAVLQVTTPSNRAFPAGFTPAALQQVFFGASTGSLASDSLTSYWQEASYGRTSASGQIIGPLALNQDFTCDQLEALLASAVAAADSSVDFTLFSRVAVVFPAAVCTTEAFGSIGGAGSIGCQSVVSPSKGTLSASAAWFPVYPLQLVSLWLGDVSHELGHNLGLNHASAESFGGAPLGAPGDPGVTAEYGDPASSMGQTWASWNGMPAIGQYSAPHKSSILNWLLPGGYQEVRSSGAFTLAPFEAPDGLRALRVLRDAGTGSWLWLEYRQPIGDVDGSLSLLGNLDGSNPFAGALVHHESQALDPQHTYLLNFNSAAGPVLAAGTSWSDPYSPLTLSVGAPTADGLPVTVSYDPPCATPYLSTTSFGASGGPGTLVVTADPGCAWTATTASNWISFTGPVSGQGSGVVGFSVAPNLAQQQRTGYLSVGRQGEPILQSGNGLTVLGVSPNSGTGSGTAFTFRFSDPNGYGDIAWVILSFGGAACQVAVPSVGGYAWLWSDTGGQWIGPAYFPPGASLGNSPNLGNSQCTLDSALSSSSGAGNEVDVTLRMAFSPSFAGTRQIAAEAITQSGGQAVAGVGAWVVSGQ
jgi:hypothetical protein